MGTVPVFDYEKEFWELFKRYETFLLYDEELLNRLPRKDLTKVLEEVIRDLKCIEENSRAKKGVFLSLIGIRDRIFRAESFLEQIK